MFDLGTFMGDFPMDKQQKSLDLEHIAEHKQLLEAALD
jgi:hypothetical protein